MEGILPKEVIYRPKTGFVAPVREWLAGPLMEKVRDVLTPYNLKRRGWFRTEAVESLFHQVGENKEDAHYLLWSLFVIETWAYMFLDGNEP